MRRLDLISGAAALAVTATQTRANAQTLEHYRAAFTATEGDAVGWLAQSQGYFAKVGIALDIQAIGNGDAAMAAIVSGDIAVGTMNSMSLALAHQNGVDVKVIGAGGEWVTGRSGTQAMVRKDSPIVSGAGLNGKTVAVNVLKGSAQISMQAWTDKHGGDSTTIKWAEVPFAAMQAALEQGRVDCASIPQPFATTALATCRSLGLPNDGIAPRYLLGIYVALGSWIAAHRDAARRINSALLATSRWYNVDPAVTVNALAAITKQDPAQIAKSPRLYMGEAITPQLLQPVIDVGAKYGILKAGFPASDVIAQL